MARADWQAKAAVGSALKTPVAIIVAAQVCCKRRWRVRSRILGPLTVVWARPKRR